jgi:hypothetical protein
MIRLQERRSALPVRVAMLEFLGGLIWPIVIVVTTVVIAVLVGVFIATRKLD